MRELSQEISKAFCVHLRFHFLSSFLFFQLILSNMTCKCSAHIVSGCTASPKRAPGFGLGKRKRYQELCQCEWCLPTIDEETCQQAAMEKVLTELEIYWPYDIAYPIQSTLHGRFIPRIRHILGPCRVQELGVLKEHLKNMHEKSVASGWILWYWSPAVVTCGYE